MFHVQKSTPDSGERIGSCVALAILLATWAVAYVAVCPADPAPRTHEARR